MNLKDYKNFQKITCVYGIHNLNTDKWYIGSCIDLHARFVRHCYYLNNNSHHSLKLQRSFNKYGIDAFEVIIIEQFENIAIEKLIELEEAYIQEYDAVDNGYNILATTKIYTTFKLTKEQIQKAIQTKCKPIIAFNLEGEFVKEYKSISDAAHDLNDQTTNISKACQKGCTHSVKGFVLIYKSEYDKNKCYRYSKPIMTNEHKEKLKIKALTNKRNRKVFELNNKNEIIFTWNSIRACERDLGLCYEYLKGKFKGNKNEVIITVNNRILKIEKSYSY